MSSYFRSAQAALLLACSLGVGTHAQRVTEKAESPAHRAARMEAERSTRPGSKKPLAPKERVGAVRNANGSGSKPLNSLEKAQKRNSLSAHSHKSEIEQVPGEERLGHQADAIESHKEPEHHLHHDDPCQKSQAAKLRCEEDEKIKLGTVQKVP
jgi:hypothetical protein